MPRPSKKPPRSDGRYEVKITVGHSADGAPVRKAFYSAISREDAKRQAQAYKDQLLLSERTFGAIAAPSHITFGQWADQWLLSYKKGKVKESTYRDSYERIVRGRLDPVFGSVRLAVIKPADISRFYSDVSGSVSSSEMHKIGLNLHGIFQSAIDNDLIFKDPSKNIRIPEAKPPKEKPTYTSEKTARICEYAKTHRYGVPVILMLQMGLRVSEVCGLKPDDIDFDRKTLTIARAITNHHGKIVVGPPKSKKMRILPMDQLTADALRQAVASAGVYLFEVNGHPFGPERMTRDRYNVFMKDLHKENPDIEVLTTHSCRHTCGTKLYNDTHDIYAVSRFLGHSSIQITIKTYVHDNVEDLRVAIGR